MRKHIKGIDHVVIAVHDLDLAADTFQRLGFTLTPRGFHDLGSQNHCIMFGDDYIELVAVPKPHPFNQYYTDFLVRGEGLAATVLKSDDAAAAGQEFAGAGLNPGEPMSLSRPVEVDGVAQHARFTLVGLPLDATPGHRMFVCEHLTRDLL
jgi:catechol 2,3-dioxygenase-like lactoylglutathione lyase family enzyme